MRGHLGKLKGLTIEEEEGSCCCDCEDERKDMAPKEPRVAEKIAISSSTTEPIRVVDGGEEEEEEDELVWIEFWILL